MLKRLARVRPRVTAAARCAMVTLDRRERRASSEQTCLSAASFVATLLPLPWQHDDVCLCPRARPLIGYLSKVMYCAQLVVGQSTISGRKKKARLKSGEKQFIVCICFLPHHSVSVIASASVSELPHYVCFSLNWACL